MNFDKILIKFCQILTIYVKIHQIHVKNIQECNFLTIKQIKVKNHPEKQIQRQKSTIICGIGVLGKNWGIGGGGIN